jgi:hypothetical protein
MDKKPKKDTGKLSKIREKKGESNAYKYVGTKAGKAYAGPDKTFPIGDKAHARNALARAHFAKNPKQIKAKVHAKYPELGKKKEKNK